METDFFFFKTDILNATQEHITQHASECSAARTAVAEQPRGRQNSNNESAFYMQLKCP